MNARRTGAALAPYALEPLPISHTFGIPGVHNTEKITPILVIHEGCGAFAADAMSRTGGGRIGCLVIVPAAGVTHAMSGIGECYLDGFTALRVAVHEYDLRPRYDRLRERGMLTKSEAAEHLGIHEATVVRWAECGWSAGTPTMPMPGFTRWQTRTCRLSITAEGTASLTDQQR